MKLSVQGQPGAVPAYAYTGGKPFDAALPCVVFIHGALHDHSVWTLLARWYAHHGHSVLALDLPGHGRSAGPALASVEALADWVWAVLDSASLGPAAPVSLVGHSLGSLIALAAAARAPERVRRLVMVGSTFPMKVSPALLDTARDNPLKAIDMVNSFSISSIAAKPSFPGPGTWLHGSNRALMRRVLAGGTGTGTGSGSGTGTGSGSGLQVASGCEFNLFHHDFSVCDRYADGLAAAARVRCPVTMVLGSLDQMTPPRSAREISNALKARTVLLPSGHSLMTEVPDGLLAALREALA